MRNGIQVREYASSSILQQEKVQSQPSEKKGKDRSPSGPPGVSTEAKAEGTHRPATGPPRPPEGALLPAALGSAVSS